MIKSASEILAAIAEETPELPRLVQIHMLPFEEVRRKLLVHPLKRGLLELKPEASSLSDSSRAPLWVVRFHQHETPGRGGGESLWAFSAKGETQEKAMQKMAAALPAELRQRRERLEKAFREYEALTDLAEKLGVTEEI